MAITEEQTESVIHALLRDTSLRSGVQLAVLLAAIYGLPARRVVELTRGQFCETSDDATVTLALGEHQLMLPDRLAAIASPRSPRRTQKHSRE